VEACETVLSLCEANLRLGVVAAEFLVPILMRPGNAGLTRSARVRSAAVPSCRQSKRATRKQSSGVRQNTLGPSSMNRQRVPTTSMQSGCTVQTNHGTGRILGYSKLVVSDARQSFHLRYTTIGNYWGPPFIKSDMHVVGSFAGFTHQSCFVFSFSVSRLDWSWNSEVN
jgi:hypothetical protein